MLALVAAGMTRDAAYRIVQRNAMASWEQRKPFRSLLEADPEVTVPESVLDEEVNYILDLGIKTHFNHYVESLKWVLDQNYDAVFVGTGAPRWRDLPNLPGRQEGALRVDHGTGGRVRTHRAGTDGMVTRADPAAD